MTRHFEMREIAAPQSAQVSAREVPHFIGIPQNGAAVDHAIATAFDVGERVARLHDLGVQQLVKQERNRLHEEMEVELREAAAVPRGAADSLFRADGSVNQDRHDAIVAKYREQNERISGGNFWLRENAVRYDGERAAENDAIALRAVQFTSLKTIEQTRDAFEDNLNLAIEKDDWEGARGLIREARGALLTDTETETRLLKLKRQELNAAAASAGYGYPTSVNVGGTEYSGLSAALAMENARSGQAAVSVDDDGADASATLARMPAGEFGAVSDAFSFGSRVLTLPRIGGGVDVSCDVNAPECVQRVAAHGNAHGGVDAEQARMMVARISLDMVADNPGVSDTQVAAVFDKAGVYEALGDGDAAVGRGRALAIVSECLERGRGDSKKLGMGTIEPMIKAHLASPDFAASREWGRVAGLNPRLAAGEEWDKSGLDEAGRKRWFGLYDVYRKYRQEFKPDAKGELDKDEFEENAQAFHAWYMKEKYRELKRADADAALDWYLMCTASALREKVYADAEGNAGYAGYGHDVQVAREVLRSMPPETLGADELVAASVASQKQDAVRSAAFRKAAAADYEKLRGLKQSEAANSEAVKKEQERKAKAEALKAEKEAREAEKKAAQLEARKLFVARSTPREAAWSWDGKNAGDGTMAQCRIPESEYKRLQEELGFDGSQLVYVQVDGARLLVTGVSKSGKLELNAPAVAKVQKKPNTRKGERWKTSGSLGYSYYFKSTEAK